MESKTPACDLLGITFSSNDEFIPSLKRTLAANITNQVVSEIFSQLPKKRKPTNLTVPWSEIKFALAQVYDKDLTLMPDSYIRTSFAEVKDKNKCTEFMKQLYILPNSHGKRRQANGDNMPPPPHKIPKFEVFGTQVQEETITSLLKEISELKRDNDKLKLENIKLRSENSSLRIKVQKWEPKRFQQKLDRKDKSRLNWSGKYQSAKTDNVEAKNTKDKYDKVHKELKKLKVANAKQKQRIKAKIVTRPKGENQATKLSVKLDEKKKEVKMTKQEVSYWQNEALLAKETLTKPAILKTKVHGKYTSVVREISYHFQDAGVAQSKVSGLVKKAAKTLTGQDLEGPLPSYSTQNNLAREMKSCSRQQVASKLQGKSANSVKYDGTTKNGEHLVVAEIATKTDTLLVGLQPQYGGKANEYFSTISDSFSGIEKSARTEDLDIMPTLANTMSDRCKTNDPINRQFEGKCNKKLNHFKCAMHPLDGFAKECEKVIKDFESSKKISELKKTGNYPFLHRGESNTQATVRCTGKLFYDVQFNCKDMLTTHLKSEGKVPMTNEKGSEIYHRFVGNRFHVYFLSSGLLYHYSESIREFFKSVCRPQNQVQDSILNALKLSALQTTTQALGIVGKVVTGPWMRFLDAEKKIFDMNPFYAEAEKKLESWSQDATPLLTNNPPSVSDKVAVRDDIVLQSLMGPADIEMQTLLQDLCGACLRVLRRQCSDQLPGGSLWEPSDEVREQAESCSATNISGERVFATADQIMYRAKNATSAHVEAKTMFRVNKTGAWIADQPDEGREKIIQHAMKDARRIRVEEKEKKICIQQKVEERIRLSRQQLQAKDDSNRTRIEHWFEDVAPHGGVWLSKQEMDANIKMLKDTKAKKILKAQINIRLKVLKCTIPKKITFKDSTRDNLIADFLLLLEAQVPLESDDVLSVIRNPESLVGLHCVQQWVKNGKNAWYEGEIVMYIEAQTEFKIKYIDDIESDAEDSDADPSYSYLTVEEVVADIIQGDFEIHHS